MSNRIHKQHFPIRADVRTKFGLSTTVMLSGPGRGLGEMEHKETLVWRCEPVGGAREAHRSLENGDGAVTKQIPANLMLYASECLIVLHYCGRCGSE